MSLLYALESIRTPFLDTVFSVITQLGGELVFMALAIIFYWCVSKSEGLYILTVGFFGTVANQFLKLVFRIPRPWVKDPGFTIVESAREAATGYSFPSGHTQNAFASFGCIGRWSKKTWVRVVCGAAVVLIAFSRMYLGVHTPLDVGVAFVMGAVLTLALYPVARDAAENPKKEYTLIGIMTACVVAYLLYVELYPFPADVDEANLTSGLKSGYDLLGACAGMLVGVWADNRYIHSPTEAPLAAQIVKSVVGLAVIVAIKTFLKAPLNALFGGSMVAEAVRYFLMVLFAAGIWPLTFKWFASWGKKKAQKV